jgi:hypothetical protein
MILSRNFIDVKRLATTVINYYIRSKWLLDYLKAIIKPLEYLINQWVTFSKNIKEYVYYNAQKGVLKVFVDDEVDVIEKRTYITEERKEGLNLYGYAKFEGNKYTWVQEYDPNPTNLYGYANFTGDTYQFEAETNPNPLTLYGYVVFQVFEALQDVDSIYIKDWYDEYIYTATDNITINQYKWYPEGQVGEDIIFWIHSSIYNIMTDIEKETLIAKIARYIPAPYTFKLQQFS